MCCVLLVVDGRLTTYDIQLSNARSIDKRPIRTLMNIKSSSRRERRKFCYVIWKWGKLTKWKLSLCVVAPDMIWEKYVSMHWRWIWLECDMSIRYLSRSAYDIFPHISHAISMSLCIHVVFEYPSYLSKLWIVIEISSDVSWWWISSSFVDSRFLSSCVFIIFEENSTCLLFIRTREGERVRVCFI